MKKSRKDEAKKKASRPRGSGEEGQGELFRENNAEADPEAVFDEGPGLVIDMGEDMPPTRLNAAAGRSGVQEAEGEAGEPDGTPAPSERPGGEASAEWVREDFDEGLGEEEALAGLEGAPGGDAGPDAGERQRRNELLEEILSLEAKVEAIIFASPKPIKPAEIEEIIGDEEIASKEIIHAIDRLLEFHESRSGGFKLEYLKNLGYQFRSVPAASPVMERMFSSRPRPLSRAAMETLAIVAYRQPVTRAEIEFIRGVDAGSILKNLLERELVKCVGRKADSGRPMLFGTSEEFLRVFRLASLEELPSLDSFQTDPALIRTAMEKLESEEAVSVEGFIAGENAGDAGDQDLEAAEAADTPVVRRAGAVADRSGLTDDGFGDILDEQAEAEDRVLADAMPQRSHAEGDGKTDEAEEGQ